MPGVSNAPPLCGAFPGVLLLQAAGPMPLQLGLCLPGWVAETLLTHLRKACEEGSQGAEERVQRLQQGPETVKQRPAIECVEGRQSVT